MDSALISLSVLPMILVNVWHTILLRMPTKGSRPHTISHHAVDSDYSLRMHRLIHTLTSIVLIIFGWFYLMPHGHNFASFLIVAAAIFDILEVFTLNKKTATDITAFNYHAITAWAMAVCYLLYVSAVIPLSGLPMLTVSMVWFSFALLLLIAILRKFKSFWITQHVYFCFLALIMITAHINLLR